MGRLRSAVLAAVAPVGAIALVTTMLATPIASAAGRTTSGRQVAAATTPLHASASSSCPGLAHAKAEIAKYKQIPKFTPPGPAFDAAKVRGKTVFDIPVSSSIPFISLTDGAMQAAAKRLGLKYILFPTQGQPSQWVAGMEQAIARHVNLIILDGSPDPRLLQPELKAAKRAGIPVIDTHDYDVSTAYPPHPQLAPNLTAIETAPFTLTARLEADYAIVATHCNAHVLVSEARDLQPTLLQYPAFRNEIARYCGPRCSVVGVSTPSADWATKLEGNIASTLISHPNINWVVPFQDGQVSFLLPAIESTHNVGKVHIATYNGTPSVLADIENGNIASMDIGENLNWLADAYLDQGMRVMLGLKPVLNENTGIRIFDKSNVAATGNPPKYSQGYGNAFASGYSKLWK